MKQLQQAQIIFLMMPLFLGGFSLELNAQCTYYEASEVSGMEGYWKIDDIGSDENKYYIYTNQEDNSNPMLVDFVEGELKGIPIPEGYTYENGYIHENVVDSDGNRYISLKKENGYNRDVFRYDGNSLSLFQVYDESWLWYGLFSDDAGKLFAHINIFNYDTFKVELTLYRYENDALVFMFNSFEDSPYRGIFDQFGENLLCSFEKGLATYDGTKLTWVYEYMDNYNNFSWLEKTSDGKLLMALEHSSNKETEPSYLLVYDGETIEQVLFDSDSYAYLRDSFEDNEGNMYIIYGLQNVRFKKYNGENVMDLELPTNLANYEMSGFINYDIRTYFEGKDGKHYFYMVEKNNGLNPPVFLQMDLSGNLQTVNVPEGWTYSKWRVYDIIELTDENDNSVQYTFREGQLIRVFPENYTYNGYSISGGEVILYRLFDEDGNLFLLPIITDELEMYKSPISSYSSSSGAILHNDQVLIRISHSGKNHLYILESGEGLKEVHFPQDYQYFYRAIFNGNQSASIVYGNIPTNYSKQILFNIEEKTCEINLPSLEANQTNTCVGDDISANLEDYDLREGYSLQYLLQNITQNTITAQNENGIFNTEGLTSGSYKICAYEELDYCKPAPSPIGGEVNKLDNIGNMDTGCSQYVCTDNIVLADGMTEDEDSAALIQSGGNLIYSIEVCGGAMPYSTDLTASTGFVSRTILPSASTNCRKIQVIYAANATWTMDVSDNVDCSTISIASDDLPGSITLPPQITSVSVTPEKCPGDKDGAIDITIENGDTSCGTYTYSWSGPNGFSKTTQNISDIGAGSYSVVVTDCSNSTISVTYNVTRTGGGSGRGGRGSGGCKTAGDWSSITDLHIAPNPFQSFAQIRFQLSDTEKVSIQLYDASGRIVRSIFDGEAEASVDYRMAIPQAAILPQGTYIVRLTTENGTIQHRKMVKMQ